MKTGAVMLLLALVLLAITYANGGSFRFTTWGLLFGGGFTLVWGYVKYATAR